VKSVFISGLVGVIYKSLDLGMGNFVWKGIVNICTYCI